MKLKWLLHSVAYKNMSADIKAMSDPLPKSNIFNVKEHHPEIETDFVSDGYHTFRELYDHRITLYIALCKMLSKVKNVWITKKHSDGSIWDGWFLLGINTESGSQITYHLPDTKWDECASFAHIRLIAPEFDGHSSNDVLDRISSLKPPQPPQQ